MLDAAVILEKNSVGRMSPSAHHFIEAIDLPGPRRVNNVIRANPKDEKWNIHDSETTVPQRLCPESFCLISLVVLGIQWKANLNEVALRLI